MAIIQQPDALSLSGNLKKIIVSSGETVSFVLKDGSTVLLDATYEPGSDSRVTIDVQDIVESRLSFLITHENFYQQQNVVKTFTAVIDGTEYTFRAIRAGVANLGDTPGNWLKGNFLTWQPTSKPVTYYSPEWLTYYAVEACTIKLKATFPDNTEQTVTIGSCEVGKAFTCNLQYAVVAGLLGQLYPSYFEVWAENAAGTRLTYIQRYLYSEPKSELEQWFLFENSLGGLDTIRAYGDTDFEGDHVHNISSIDGTSSEYRIDTKRSYNQNTGYLNEYERRWLLDFFPSQNKFVHSAGAIRSVIVTDSDVKYTASDLPSSYNFKYQFSDDSAGLLNLIRNEDQIPEVITIPDLDSPDFSLPPRLSEYPRVQLHGGVIIPAFDPNSSNPTVTTLAAIIASAIGETIDHIPGSESGGQLVKILKTLDESPATDENVFSSLRVIAEILKNNETFKDLYLSKRNDDTAQGIIKFIKGIEIGAFTTGPLGAGASLKMENGVSRLEVDQLDVRMRATFRELIIESLKHIGGQLILSLARMKCNKVVDGGTYYKCYFDTGDGKVSNEFVAGDQARCQVFTGSGVKMYWRLVTSVGTDWINLSKTDAISGSSIPEAGDDIVQLGHRTDTTRQNAQILSTVGADAPSWKQYKGINAFSLEGKDTTVFSGTGNKIDGKTVFMSSGANVEDGINSKNSNYSSQPTSYKANDTWTLSADTTVNGTLYKKGFILTATQDSSIFVEAHWVKRDAYTDDTAVKNLQIGGDNLLRNAGFVGDFASIELDSQQTIEASTELFNNRLAYWEQTGTLTIVDEPLAKYGKAIVMNGSISQAVQSISNDKYKFRVKGKGNVSVSFSGNTKTIDLGDTYTEIELDFKGDGLLSQFIISSENATIFNPKLERGTVATDMSLHHLDENPAFERLLSYQYILDAIGNGSTSILGGLILTSMIQLGKYKDGVMEKVNAGISGIYNNDNDPAVWAGGTMEMAIRTVQKFIANPNYQPTEAEWAEMAKIVFTHGGDGFFRGYIYALGGFFRGRIESNVDGNRIIVNPENRSIEMINSQNRLSGQIFFSEGSGWGAVQFYDYHANGTLKTVAALDLVNGVYFSEYADGNPVPVKITYNKNGQIQNGGIPSMTDAQADTLLVSGEWYRDGRTIKIKP